MLVFAAIVTLIGLTLLSTVRFHIFIYNRAILRVDFLFFRITYNLSKKKDKRRKKTGIAILTVVTRPLRYIISHSNISVGQLISVHSPYALIRRGALQYLFIPFASSKAKSFEKSSYYSLDEDLQNDIYNVYLDTRFIFFIISLIIFLCEAMTHIIKSRFKYAGKQIKRNNQSIS